MNAKALAYWTATAAIVLELLVGGVADLARLREVIVAGQPVEEALRQLGYLAYLLTILGGWKVLGAAAILAPRLPRVKEWAYAGTFFELTGAALSAVMAGAVGNAFTPAALAAIAAVSWALRPPDRMLGTLSLRRAPAPQASSSERCSRAQNAICSSAGMSERPRSVRL